MICCTCSGFFPLPFGAGRAALRSFPVLIGEFTICTTALRFAWPQLVKCAAMALRAVDAIGAKC